MIHHGFVRVAAASPALRVADCEYNAGRIVGLIGQAEREGVSVLVFPELAITGYTCGDLFHHAALLDGALVGLQTVVKATQGFVGVVAVGVPLRLDDQLFNCAAVIFKGKILGLVPKSYLPNYKEFYEDRWFSAGLNARSKQVTIDGAAVPVGPDLLFDATDAHGRPLGVEFGEDVGGQAPPSCYQAPHGATILPNPTASNELIGKANYRRQLIANQSGRCIASYVYSACGVGESTTDLVF